MHDIYRHLHIQKNYVMLSPNTLNVQKQLKRVFVNGIYKYNTII